MISLIISAHNEEKNISQLLKDLYREVRKIKEKKEVFLGLSNCNDQTEKIAKRISSDLGFNINLIKTPAGKVNSQIKCLKKINNRSWAIIFLDCDIKIKENSLTELIKDAKRYKDVKLFYSQEIPLNRKSIFYNIINVRTINPKYVLSKRDVSLFHPYSIEKQQKIFFTGGMYLLRKGVYDLNEENIGDDSYLTHSIYHRFGVGTIKKTQGSIIYYQPVYTFFGWINKWKRIWGDLENIYLKYPEFRYLEKYMSLKIDFRRLFRERRFKLMFYFFLERLWNKSGKKILRPASFSSQKGWKQLKETKILKYHEINSN